jgi:hypothetical protein
MPSPSNLHHTQRLNPYVTENRAHWHRRVTSVSVVYYSPSVIMVMKSKKIR